MATFTNITQSEMEEFLFAQGFVAMRLPGTVELVYGKVMRKAIGFGLGKHLQDLRDHRRCRVAFQPIINSYNGRESVELQVADIQFPT